MTVYFFSGLYATIELLLGYAEYSGWNGDNEALQAYRLPLFHPHNFYCKADFDLPYCYFNSPF